MNSDKLRVRFTYGNVNQEVPCQFEEESKALYCKTPKFEEFEGQAHPSLSLPCNCVISITTDGMNYSECEETFKVYNHMNLQSVAPKSGSVSGGTKLELKINIDDETAKDLPNLLIGFHPSKKRVRANQASRREQSSINKNQSMDETEEGKDNRALNASQHSSVKGSSPNITANKDDDPINPLDVLPGDPELHEGGWV